MMKARTAREMHLTGMAFWALNLPVVIATYAFAPAVWAKASILYLALVSVYANFVGHWGGYSAERPTEVEEA